LGISSLVEELDKDNEFVCEKGMTSLVVDKIVLQSV
jgi:hypothetical protein